MRNSGVRGLNATKQFKFKKSDNLKRTSDVKAIASTNYGNGKYTQPWMFFDDEFADKQCQAYTAWLNYIIKPHEESFGQQQRQQNHEYDGKNNVDNPTLRSLLLERRQMQAIQRAMHFFNGPEMKRIRKVIRMEVISKRLALRSDHDVLANVNLKSQMISLLLSYSTPWLKLGLETLFGETISLNMATKPFKKTLKIRKSLGIATPHAKMVSL